MSLAPFRLLPYFDRRPWGRLNLEPWFPPASEPIGEVWFHERNQSSCGQTLEELIRRHGRALLGSRAATPVFPILSKLIFTAERLSIQVHPDDDYARRHENQWGKIEMWYVLRAEPGARLAMGLREPVGKKRFVEAARNGEIERLVNWIEVHPGQVFVIYPGTVHALGAGVVLAEIQQNSDLTYRIYDYGRPRPLHLEQAVEVASLGPYPGCPAPVDLGEGRKLLARTNYFATELLEITRSWRLPQDQESFQLLLVLEGCGRLGSQACRAGECWFVPAASPPFELEAEQPLRLLRSYLPEPLLL